MWKFKALVNDNYKRQLHRTPTGQSNWRKAAKVIVVDQALHNRHPVRKPRDCSTDIWGRRDLRSVGRDVRLEFHRCHYHLA